MATPLPSLPTKCFQPEILTDIQLMDYVDPSDDGAASLSGPLTFDPLAASISKWQIVKVLGRGQFAIVYLALNTKGKSIAVKMLELPDRHRELVHAVERIGKELTALRKAGRHANVVRYHHFQFMENRVYMFFEYCPEGSLWRKYSKDGPLPAAVTARYTRHILSGLEWVHKQGIIHRDIKCLNVLIGAGDVAKLADFGCAAIMKAVSQTSLVGTYLWMAPEVVLVQGHHWQADVWSLGCTVMEMLTAKKPLIHLFKGKEYLSHAAVAKLHNTLNEIPCEVIEDPTARDFVKRCLQKNYQVRPGCTELLAHNFVRDIDDTPHVVVAKEAAAKK
eukprot:TRINITY_DN12332_c0_g1_i1.p1 TRINITY_DN12332_c0_g1~~TRINITY_DN12332_c0_g1_i1.p1  ORF type:complete len:375 (+),score=53.05 TRINITY_DN12332_c0_g1_i1:127-1125(+)